MWATITNYINFGFQYFIDLDKMPGLDVFYILFPGWWLFYFPVLLWFGYGFIIDIYFAEFRKDKDYFEKSKPFNEKIAPVLRILFSYLTFLGFSLGLSITNLPIPRNLDFYFTLFFLSWTLYSPTIFYQRESLRGSTWIESIIVFLLFTYYLIIALNIYHAIVIFLFFGILYYSLYNEYNESGLGDFSSSMDFNISIFSIYVYLSQYIKWYYLSLLLIILLAYLIFILGNVQNIKKYKKYYLEIKKWHRDTKQQVIFEIQQNIFLELVFLFLLGGYLIQAYQISYSLIFKILNTCFIILNLNFFVAMINSKGSANLSSFVNRTTDTKDTIYVTIYSFLILHLCWDFNLWVFFLTCVIVMNYLFEKGLFYISSFDSKGQIIFGILGEESNDDFISERSQQINSLGKKAIFLPAYKNRIFRLNDWLSVDELIRLSSHILLFWNSRDKMPDDTQRLEWLFRSSLRNPHIVFDCFSLTSKDFESELSFTHKDPLGRIAILLKLTDELPPPLENYYEPKQESDDTETKKEGDEKNNAKENKNEIQTTEKSFLVALSDIKSALLRELSIDVHKENDFLFQLLKKKEKAMIEKISQNSIFELCLMYRQVFELNNAAARFLGFIDLLECVSLYLTSILFSESSKGEKFWEDAEDSKLESLTFGKSNALLREWEKKNRKTELDGIKKGLRKTLVHEFTSGFPPLEKLKEFAEEGFGVIKENWTKEHQLIEVLEFFSAIRNKTRGHGSPTKIPTLILVPLQTVVIHILDTLQAIQGSLICVVQEESHTYYLDMRAGGLPIFLSPHKEGTTEVAFDFSNEYDTEEDQKERQERTQRANELNLSSARHGEIFWGNQDESWKLSKVIKYHNGRLYLLSDYKKKLYISHSSGDVVRPEQMRADAKKTNLNKKSFLKNEAEDLYTKKIKEEVEERKKEERKREIKECLPKFRKNFIRIPSGSFTMGATENDTKAEKDEKPSHKVVISQDFEMGIYPVTQNEWEVIMGNNPSGFKKAGGTAPVENVSYLDVKEFIQRLNELEGFSNEKGYRLPTEAEWEYAARAGSNSRYGFGDNESDLTKYSWFADNSYETIHPVGQKKPNAWGLYDMIGNVWEWCEDWYDKDYYKNTQDLDPRGPANGDGKTLRGGACYQDSHFCRISKRNFNTSDYKSQFYGFRLVRNID